MLENASELAGEQELIPGSETSSEHLPAAVAEEGVQGESEQPSQQEEEALLDDVNNVGEIETTHTNRFERIALILLTASAWTSGIFFGCFIIGHYLLAGHDIQRWNTLLPSLYSTHRPVATVGIGMHFVGGAVTIILGAIQLMGPIRKRFPAFHRWTGRLYVTCSTMTAVGGFTYIVMGSGCIGGKTMDIAFSLCALLTVISSFQTYRHAAITKRFDRHQLWAWRLYSLMISSWMYRLEYATAELLRIPHDPEHYSYALDYVMDFFFYVPNLIVVEILWRTRHKTKAPWVSNTLAVIMVLVTMLLLFTSSLNAIFLWIPGMMGKLADLRSDDDEYDGSL